MKRKIRNEKLRKWRARRNRTTRACAGSGFPRVTVFRSSKHIYAQLIDPVSGRTLGGVSSLQKGVTDGATGNVEAAKRVGKALADLIRMTLPGASGAVQLEFLADTTPLLTGASRIEVR